MSPSAASLSSCFSIGRLFILIITDPGMIFDSPAHIIQEKDDGRSAGRKKISSMWPHSEHFTSCKGIIFSVFRAYFITLSRVRYKYPSILYRKYHVFTYLILLKPCLPCVYIDSMHLLKLILTY